MPNATERTDKEIYAAWLAYFRRMLEESKEPDKPVIGCMCHLLSLRQIVGCLEKLDRGEQIDPVFGHAVDSFVDTSAIREVARRWNKDPVALIGERPTPKKETSFLGRIRNLLS